MKKWNLVYQAQLERLEHHIEGQQIEGTPEHPQDAAFNNLLDSLLQKVRQGIEEGFEE